MLNSRTHSFYVCDSSHLRYKHFFIIFSTLKRSLTKTTFQENKIALSILKFSPEMFCKDHPKPFLTYFYVISNECIIAGVKTSQYAE
jgi:hypothetical protein